MQSWQLGIPSLFCAGASGAHSQEPSSGRPERPGAQAGRRCGVPAGAGQVPQDGVGEDRQGDVSGAARAKAAWGQLGGQMSQRRLMDLEPGHDIRHLREIQQCLAQIL